MSYDENMAGHDDPNHYVQQPQFYGLDVWSYMARLGVQMRGAGDDFFADGDKVCAMRTCQYLTQIDLEELLHQDLDEFSCQVPGCRATFKQLIDNEAHYNAKHRHSCSECRKNLPSAPLLDLHISETHDSYFSLMAMKKASYECFVQACSDKFWTPKERKEHCVHLHSFPTDFKFEPKKLKAGSASPEVVKRKNTGQKVKKKVRPASVFVAPMETEQHHDEMKNFSQKFVSSPPISSKSKLPVLNRRLSLNAKDSNAANSPTTIR